VSPGKQVDIGPGKLAHLMGLLEEYELPFICLFVRLGHVPTLHTNLAETFSSHIISKREMLTNITQHQTFGLSNQRRKELQLDWLHVR
jgi:hypothetical protein